MQFRISLFLCLSSALAGVLCLIIGFFWPGFFDWYQFPEVEELGTDLNKDGKMAYGWTMGLRLLGVLLLTSSLILLFIRKKLSNLSFAGIFAVSLLICLMVASAAAGWFAS